MKKTVLFSLKTAIPVMTGYLVLGIGFGLVLESKGYGPLWAGAMGICMYAGSMQYLAVDLLSSGATLISTALVSLMVSARQLFYGISMVDKYKDTGKEKPYLIYAMSDETYSLVCDPDLPEDVDRKRFYLFVSMFDQISWVVGDIIGGLIGSALTFDTTGVDFAMTAIFVVIFVEQWEKTKQHLPAILGLGVTIICRLVFGAESFLIPAMIGITVGLFLMRKKLDAEPEENGEDEA